MKNILVIKMVILLIFIFNDYASALCVSALEANLRSGPGTNYEKTWVVFKYMPFKRLSQKRNWYKVQDVDGDNHWIYRKLVNDKFKCAVVKVEKANVRSGPDTHFRKMNFSPSMKYDSYKVLNIKGPWVKVRGEFGDQGWIFRKLLWIY